MSEEVKTRFETSGKLTSELLRKTCIEFMARNRKSKVHRVLIVVIWIEILIAISLAISVGDNNVWPILLIGVAYVLLDLLLEWGTRRTTKMTVRRFEEEHHTGIAPYTTAFSDTQVHLHNHASGAAGTIDLSNMKRLMKVEDTWVLATKTAAFIPVFVSQLSETDQESLLALLKEKNPKIKIDLKRKK